MQERFAATATASAALALAAVIFAAAGARSCAAPRVSPMHEPAPAAAVPWTLTASDGMGLLQILRHDGAGGLSFEDRPYIVMNDHAQVDLGEVR